MPKGLTAALIFAVGLSTVGALRLLEREPASAPRPEGMADSLMGVNEAVAVSLKLIRDQGLEAAQLEPLFLEDAELTAGLGARWVRAHSAVTPDLNLHAHQLRGGDFSVADAWVRATQSQDLQVLMMLSPWPGNRTAQFTERYVVEDEAAYVAFVKSVVERYDGDGVEDMPGLRYPIRHWEVDNEPDLKNTQPPRGGPAREDFCTPAQYAAVLRLTAAAIREADPEAVVLNGGFYRPMTRPGRAYMEAVFAEPGVLDAVDVISVHAYSSGPGLGRVSEAIRAGLAVAEGRPVWLTETSLPSAGEEAWLSEPWQADMLVRLYVEALRLGAQKVFWHTLADPPLGVGKKAPGMRHNSLMQADLEGARQDKPSALAYRRLATALAETPWSALGVTPWGVELGERLRIVDGAASVPEGWQSERAWDGAPLSEAGDAALLLRRP
ncbi:MAG: hypothetical protein H6741_29620 [Alphaproteobacteria bacterium]|nr:hypothetical protein [Alphaproteobacteria bacterium]MCB9796881.1 hypothetical protein [Alphaproteobacteria bacterium]